MEQKGLNCAYFLNYWDDDLHDAWFFGVFCYRAGQREGESARSKENHGNSSVPICRFPTK